MHFSTVAASAAIVGSALASQYYDPPSYYTTTEAAYPYATHVYTSCSSAEPVYHTPAPYYSKPAKDPYVVTYTSYAHITVTSCADYVKYCPAKVYTSTVYSVSTCSEYGSEPTDYDTPYYVPPGNTTDYYVPPYETPEPYPTETHTYYTTVCPYDGYCYGTTITTTWCHSATPVYYPPTTTPCPESVPVYHTTTYCPPTETPVYHAPVYSTPVYVPPKNETPTYNHPPSYTGAASSNVVSFGVAAIAGLVALFIAA